MSIAANIVTLEHDHVLIRAKDSREWPVALEDVPPELCLEGQSVFIEHDADGYATAISMRTPDPLPDEILQRIDNICLWTQTL